MQKSKSDPLMGLAIIMIIISCSFIAGMLVGRDQCDPFRNRYDQLFDVTKRTENAIAEKFTCSRTVVDQVSHMVEDHEKYIAPMIKDPMTLWRAYLRPAPKFQ